MSFEIPPLMTTVSVDQAQHVRGDIEAYLGPNCIDRIDEFPVRDKCCMIIYFRVIPDNRTRQSARVRDFIFNLPYGWCLPDADYTFCKA